MSVSIRSSDDAIKFIRDAMVRLGWSQGELARRTQQRAAQFLDVKVQQQHIQNFLAGKNKKLPSWYSFAADAILQAEGGLAALKEQLHPYRAGAGIPTRLPDAADLKRFVPQILRATIGLDRGPAVNAICAILADVLTEIGNRPSLLSDPPMLKIITEDMIAKKR